MTKTYLLNLKCTERLIEIFNLIDELEFINDWYAFGNDATVMNDCLEM